MMHIPEGFTGTIKYENRYENGRSVDICEVWQGNDSEHLLLVLNDWVINGEWPLSYARENNFKITKIGYISRPYGENYNKSLNRFRDGDRMILDECQCCGHKDWKK